MGRKIGVLLAQGLEVSNFLKDVPRVPKSVSKRGTTSNHFLKILNNERTMLNKIGVSVA